jgi:hypothetical protein
MYIVSHEGEPANNFTAAWTLNLVMACLALYRLKGLNYCTSTSQGGI